jgi:salicylate hydroxylase
MKDDDAMLAADLQNLKIAIVGAGYGGASAGKALSLLGADVTVYEQASRIREVGAGIGLRPTTMEQFRRWGSFDAVAAVSSPSDYFEAFTPTGEPLLKEAWPDNVEGDDTRKTHLIHRGDFIDALVSVLPEGMIRVGYKLTDIEDLGDRAQITFANGEKVTADLVIGADGIRSTVRAKMFEDKAPVFSGEVAFRVVVNSEDAFGLVTDDNFRMYIGRGTKVYFLPLRHRNQVSFDVTFPSSDRSWSPQGTKEELLAAMQGFDERLVAIARNLDMATVNIRSAYDIDPIDVWHTGSVVLLGDAAHAMLHHQGQGANSAILDVRGLTDALEEADTVSEALALYQGVRKPVTDELQRFSRQGYDDSAVTQAFAERAPTPSEA